LFAIKHKAGFYYPAFLFAYNPGICDKIQLNKEADMKKNKTIGLLLLVLAVYTSLGMVLANDAYWGIYNYVTLVFSIVSGIALLKQK
jgi:hypothetical protein